MIKALLRLGTSKKQIGKLLEGEDGHAIISATPIGVWCYSDR